MDKIIKEFKKFPSGSYIFSTSRNIKSKKDDKQFLDELNEKEEM